MYGGPFAFEAKWEYRQETIIEEVGQNKSTDSPQRLDTYS